MKKLLFFLLVSISGIIHAQTFYRQYGGPAVDEGGQTLTASPDGNMFVGGYKGDSALVLKTDLAGNIIWSRALRPVPSLPNGIHQLVVSPDNYLVGIGGGLGASGRFRDGFIFKMDMAGNLIWINRVVDTREMTYESVEAYSSTHYRVFVGAYDLSASSWMNVTSILFAAATGNALSNTPQYDMVTSNPFLDFVAASTMNTAKSRFYTTGRIYVSGSSPGSMRVFLNKHDAAGALLQSSYLIYNASATARMYGTDIAYTNDSLMISYFGDVTGSSGNFTVGLIRADTNGNVAWSKNYNIPAWSTEYCARVLPHANGYFLVSYGTPSGDFFILSLSLSGNVLWTRAYGGAGTAEDARQLYSPMAEIIGSHIYFTGQSTSGGNTNLIIAAVDFNGNISCMAPSTPAVTTTSNPTTRTSLTPQALPLSLTYSMPSLVPSALPLPDLCPALTLDLGNDTSTCTALTLNATTPSATAYLWSTGATTPTISVSTGGTYSVMVSVNCCIYTDTIIVSGSGAPQAQFLSNIQFCDSSITLNNTSGNAASYYWSFGDGDTSTLASPSHTYPGPGTYSLVLIATNACGADTVSQNVIVQSVPTANITGNDTICLGQSVVLTASGGNSVQWSGGSSATTYTITDTPQNTTVYYATVANGMCEGAPDTFTVFVRPAPTVTISGQTNICAGQNIVLTANGVGNYQWSGGSSATTASINVAPLTTTTYYVTSSDGICTSAPDTFTVNILPTPIVSIVGPTTICIGQTVTLAATGASSYQWSGGANDTTPTISVSPVTTTTYYSSPSSMSSCPGIGDTITVTVIPTPIVNVGGNTTICAGQSTTLTASGGTSYQWSGGSTDTTASIVVTPLVTTTYFVTTSNGPCTSPYDTITVTVLPSPTVNIVGGGPICAGTTITLTAVGTATTWVWSGGASGTGTTITDNPNSPTTYYLIGYNAQGCSDTDMVFVGVFDTPTFAIQGDDTICTGESTTLLCTGNGTFNWSPATGLNSTTSQTVIASPTTTITYSVQVTDINGCTGADQFTLVIDPCTGIEEETDPSGITVFPNPSTGVYSINFHTTQPVVVEVYDALGQVIVSETVTMADGALYVLDLGSAADGTYLLKVTGETGTATKELVLVR